MVKTQGVVHFSLLVTDLDRAAKILLRETDETLVLFMAKGAVIIALEGRGNEELFELSDLVGVAASASPWPTPE